MLMPGYTHLQRAQPVLFAHHLLAYVEMFERDKSRYRHCREQTGRHAPGLGRAGGYDVSHRPGLRGQAPGLPAPLREQHRRRQRPGLRAGVPVRFGHSLRASQPDGGRAHPVVQRGVRFRRVAGRLLHRQLDDAAEEEPRRGRVDPRQDRAGVRPPQRPPDHHERAAAGLQPGPPGGQGAAVRHRGHGRGLPAHGPGVAERPGGAERANAWRRRTTAS